MAFLHTFDEHRLAQLAGNTEPNPLRALWQRWQAHRARRRTIDKLRALDERTLQDIGLSVGEIDSVVYDRKRERVRCYDERWAGSSSL